MGRSDSFDSGASQVTRGLPPGEHRFNMWCHNCPLRSPCREHVFGIGLLDAMGAMGALSDVGLLQLH